MSPEPQSHDPDDPWEQIRRLVGEDRYEDALTAVEQRLRLIQGDEEGQLLRARILELMSRWDDADAAYRETLRIFPKCTEAYAGMIKMLALGFGSDTKEDHRRIASLCQELQQIHPGAVPYNIQGKSYSRLEDYAAAVTAFDKAIAQQEKIGSAYLAVAEDPAQDLDIRTMASQEYDESQDKLYDAWSCKGTAQEQLGRFEEAIHSYGAAIAVNCARGQEQDSYREYYALGYAFEHIGDEVASTHCLERARQLEEAFDNELERDLHGCTEDEFNDMLMHLAPKHTTSCM